MNSASKIAPVLAALAITATVALGLELNAHLWGKHTNSASVHNARVMTTVHSTAVHPQKRPVLVPASASASEPPATRVLPSPAATVQVLRPDAPPRIIAMSLSTSVVHEGDVVTGVVQTSSNVASVEARIAGYSSGLTKIGEGRFALSYRVPKLPAILHRTYTIEVIARNTRGDAVTGSVPITIQ